MTRTRIPERAGLAATLIAALMTFGCDKKGSTTGSAAPLVSQATVASAPSTPQGPGLVTKDPEFWKYATEELPKPPESELLTTYSPTWNSKMQEIVTRAAAISDPELRRDQSEKLKSKVDKEFCMKEAQEAFRVQGQKYSEARAAYFAKHANDWFEVGHYSSYSSHAEIVSYGSFHLISEWAALPETHGSLDIPMSIQNMDTVLAKFKSEEKDNILAATNAEWNAITARMDPYAYYRRELGVSDAEATKMIDRERSGMYKKHEEKAIKNGLILVARGEPMTRKVTTLALMAYNSGKVLMEFSPEIVARLFPATPPSSKSNHQKTKR